MQVKEGQLNLDRCNSLDEGTGREEDCPAGLSGREPKTVYPENIVIL
jgi:hypothetical protein